MTLTIARSAQPVVIQLWGVTIGLHESEISLLIAFGAGLELVFMFLGAYIKDRLGRVATLVACLTIFGSGFIVMVCAPSLIGMIVSVSMVRPVRMSVMRAHRLFVDAGVQSVTLKRFEPLPLRFFNSCLVG